MRGVILVTAPRNRRLTVAFTLARQRALGLPPVHSNR
jgi:hypothetical protein